VTQAPFDVIAGALDGAGGFRQVRFALHSAEGIELPLVVDRWMEKPDVREERVLARAIPPVLDVGCGPGRHTIALTRRGVGALGLDESPAVVRVASRRGAAVLRGSVFEHLPGRGRWGTVLLLDGNMGIGGDPFRLLRRVRSLLRLGGRALLELDSTESTLRRLLVRVSGVHGHDGERFAWAVVGPDAIHPLARSTGFRVQELWRDGSRWFTRLDAV
jgi:SAM-dependent methyltransferase